MSPKEPEWLDVDFGGIKSRGACLPGITKPITCNAEVLQTTKPPDTPADGHALTSDPDHNKDGGSGSGGRRGKAQAYGKGGAVSVSLPTDYWNFMVAVTISGVAGGGSGYGSRDKATEGTFHVMLNPGHFHREHQILNGAQSIELLFKVDEGNKKAKEFNLEVELYVTNDRIMDKAILMKNLTLGFNNADACRAKPGAGAGGCAAEFELNSRCSNKPTEAWGGKYGVLANNRCGAAPLNNADCNGEAECLDQFKDELAASCRTCCMKEANDAGRYGERTQGCCQFIWYENAASLCIWKAGQQTGYQNTGDAAIAPAPQGANTLPEQNRALLCDCRKRGSCKES